MCNVVGSFWRPMECCGDDTLALLKIHVDVEDIVSKCVGGSYQTWTSAIVRDIAVGPWACCVCCCGSVRVYFERVSVCSLNNLMCIQRTYDCSHGAAELSRSYQCTGQTSVHGAWPSFPMRIRAGAFEHSIERTMHAARTRACGARACGKSLGRGAARACGARGATGCSVEPAQCRPTEQVAALPFAGPDDPGWPELTSLSVCVHVRRPEVLSTNRRAPIGPMVVVP